MDSLFAPLGPLSPHLEPYRFWIWLQIVMIRAYVRAVRGKGVLFSTLIDRRGNVYLNWIEKDPEDLTPDPFGFTPSKAYQEALTGPDPAHPGERRDLPQIAAPSPR
ncbi:MAG TPA: hypothetical protein DDY28_15030, partial [Hyphomonas atlantica]|nr:hypothetical protein [Hyphomonas atlantica]